MIWVSEPRQTDRLTELIYKIYIWGPTNSYKMGYQGETWGINSVELHPQPSENYRHSVDGAVVGGRFTLAHLKWSNKRPGNWQYGLFHNPSEPRSLVTTTPDTLSGTRTLSSLQRTTDVIRVTCCSGALLLGNLLRICFLILKLCVSLKLCSLSLELSVSVSFFKLRSPCGVLCVCFLGLLGVCRIR